MKRVAADHSPIKTLTIPGGNTNPSHEIALGDISLHSAICSRIYDGEASSHLYSLDHGDFKVRTFHNKGMIVGIYHNDEKIIVAFRGSMFRIPKQTPLGADAPIKTKYKWEEIGRGFELQLFDRSTPSPIGGRISKIVEKTLDSKATIEGEKHSLYDATVQALNEIREQHPNAKVTLTGHSLGGMLASGFAGRYLAQHPKRPLDGLFTYAQPRTGTVDFNKALEKNLKGPYVRFAIDKDVVGDTPSAPLPSPLRWEKKDSEEHGRRVHGGTGVIYYTDEERFNNEVDVHSYGYAERHERPHLRILIPPPEKLLGHKTETTPMRRHAIKTHHEIAKHMEKSLRRAHYKEFNSQPNTQIDAEDSSFDAPLLISSEIGCRA